MESWKKWQKLAKGEHSHQSQFSRICIVPGGERKAKFYIFHSVPNLCSCEFGFGVLFGYGYFYSQQQLLSSCFARFVS